MKMKNNRWWIAWYVGLVGLATMFFEMAAFRLFTPVFGGSIVVWGSIIGVVMSALAVGYWYGGRMSKQLVEMKCMFRIVGIAGVYAVCIPLFFFEMLEPLSVNFLSNHTASLIVGSLVAAVVLFGAPVAALGAVTPLAIGFRTKDIDHAGKQAGRIYSASTIGSIFGTFLATFLLLPFYGVDVTILIAAGVCMAISIPGINKK